jgi:hypothetical protein
MARPKTPSNVLQLNGAYKKNPNRKPDEGTEPELKAGVGEPPEYLDADAKALWHEIVSLACHGVLGDSDRLIVELAATLMAEFRRGGRDETGKPLFSDARLSRLQAALGQLGMTPADRSKVKIPQKAKPANAFSDL